MTIVFDATIPDLEYVKKGKKRKAKASSVKIVLLSYADHANDEGEGAYPGYNRLETKTALSRQGIADTLDAIKQNNLMVFDGISKLNTNSYHLNKSRLLELVKPLDSYKSSHLKKKVKPLDLKHPLTTPEPSLSLTPVELSNLEIFTNAFGMFVSNKEGVRWYEFVEKHKPTCAREIVQWALKKEIHLTNRASLMDSIETAAERWSERNIKNGAVNGNKSSNPKSTRPAKQETQPTESDLALAERINAARAAKRAAMQTV